MPHLALKILNFYSISRASPMGPDNVVDKYMIFVQKSCEIVGHLPVGENRRFARLIFIYFYQPPNTT